MKRIPLLSLVLLLAVVSGVWGDTLPNNRHIFINVANDAGVKYDVDGAAYSGPSNTYYIKADGGGLGSNHITTDPANSNGQTTIISTSSNSVSGTFYLNDTGGRGFTDNTILLLSSNAPFAENFSVNIKASGYTWVPNPTANVAPTTYSYVTNALDETFTAADFIYGPHSFKPGPGTLGTWSLPLYYGEDTTATSHYFMFIDLGLGMLNGTPTGPFPDALDRGSVKVEFTFNNLYSDVTFNMYGWCLNSNQKQGINFTNTTNSATASNGYVIKYTGSVWTPALTIGRTGTGAGTVTSPAGIDCGATCSVAVAQGAEVTLTAAPDAGSTFTGWAGAGCTGTGTCTVTMTAAKNVTATFTINTYSVTATSGVNGTLSCTSPVNYGSNSTCTISSAAGYRLALLTDNGVTVNGSVSGDAYTISNVTAEHTVEAVFTTASYTLTVTKSGTGSGNATVSVGGLTWSSSVGTAVYEYNTSVTVTATADAGSTFTGWAGEGCTGTGICTVTMTTAKNVTATFTSNDTTGPTLTIRTPKNNRSLTTSTVAVSGTATDSRKGNHGIASVTINGVRADNDTASGSDTASWSRTISLEAGINEIVVIATDGVGISTTKSIFVNHVTAPTLKVKAPGNNRSVTTSSITVSGTATDSKTGDSGISSVTVNGERADNDTATGDATASWSKDFALTPGLNRIDVVATDGLGNTTTKSINITRLADNEGPVLSIRTPRNNKKITTTTVTISGTASDARRGGNGIASVTVNGVRANNDTASGSDTASWSMILSSGPTSITVVATDTVGKSTEKTITVIWNVAAAETNSTPATAVKEPFSERKIPEYEVTLRTIGSGSGDITSVDQRAACGSQCTAYYPEGAEVTLRATPDGASFFAGWSGSACEGTDTCKIIIYRDTTVNAAFADTSASDSLLLLDRDGHAISIIDTTTEAVTTLASGQSLSAFVAVPSGDRAYVADSTDNSVSLIDMASRAIIDTIPVGNAPSDLVINPTGTKLYVINGGEGTISVIDAVESTVTATIPTDTTQSVLALDPEERYLYLASGEVISVRSPETGDLIAEILVNDKSSSTDPVDENMKLAVSPGGTHIYATTGARLVVIDISTREVTETIPIGTGPHALAVHPSGEKVYVTNGTDGTLSVIDRATYTAYTLSTGPAPSALTLSPAGDRLYVTCSDGIDVIDTTY